MVIARLWADHRRECDPIAVIEIATTPIELVTPAEFGLETVWALRSRFVPDRIAVAEPTADYEFTEIR